MKDKEAPRAKRAGGEVTGMGEEILGPPFMPLYFWLDGREWNRFYTPEQVSERLAAGWEPLWMSYESVDGKTPTPSRVPILYGWRRRIDANESSR